MNSTQAFLAAAVAAPTTKPNRQKKQRSGNNPNSRPPHSRELAPQQHEPDGLPPTSKIPSQKPSDPTIPPHATVDYDPHKPWQQGTDWFVVGWIGIVHLGALAAPFVFTWQALVYTIVTIWITASWGICMGYHRLLTHNSFQTYRPVRWALALLGSLTGEGSALTWVANHRMHHQYSDKDGDPHSPRDGGLWSHMVWFMPNQGKIWKTTLYEHYIPDLYKDPVMRFLDKTFLLWHWVVGMATLLIAAAIWDWYTAWSFVVWGVFVRMVYSMHITWFVNSATHKWGYRNYQTTDDSTNLWWVGLAAFGEGWHNNHHAYQRMAKHGHKWWEIDMTYWAILTMEKLGLAWNVVKDPPKHGKPA